MTDTVNLPELPELPEPRAPHEIVNAGEWSKYTHADMRAYATAAVLAERERCAAKAAEMDCAHRCGVGAEVASAIRGSSPASQGEGE